MQYVRGQAEPLLEALDIYDIVTENGASAMFKALEDKYMPQPRDLPHHAPEYFSYDLQVNPTGSYVQVLARCDAAHLKLVEQKLSQSQEDSCFRSWVLTPEKSPWS